MTAALARPASVIAPRLRRIDRLHGKRKWIRHSTAIAQSAPLVLGALMRSCRREAVHQDAREADEIAGHQACVPAQDEHGDGQCRPPRGGGCAIRDAG